MHKGYVKLGIPLEFIDALADCSLDALFVGGFSGPWKMNRQMGQVRPGSPYVVHAEDVSFELDRLSCLAEHTALPVTFVGGVSIDVHSVLLLSGNYYSQMAELALPSAWTRVEQNLEVTRDYSHDLHFLHTSRLALDCPGVRCDGVHYAKPSRDGVCQPTKNVWFPMVADKLLALGLSDGATVLKRRRLCHARQRERQAAAAANPDATTPVKLHVVKNGRMAAPHISTLLHRCLLANLNTTRFKASGLEQLAGETARGATAADRQTHIMDLAEWQRKQVEAGISEAIQ
jgi:hypothetical protein